MVNVPDVGDRVLKSKQTTDKNKEQMETVGTNQKMHKKCKYTMYMNLTLNALAGLAFSPSSVI